MSSQIDERDLRLATEAPDHRDRGDGLREMR